MAAAVLAIGWRYGARSVGGADSYGYVSQAYLWLAGTPVQHQRWTEQVPWPDGPLTFEPLGYTTTGISTLVPRYSPGLPLLMALAILVGGACAVFAVAPIFGACAVMATYLLGRRVTSPWGGVAAAWLVLTSPTFLYMAVQPMSDVPVTGAWLVAWILAYRATARAALAGGLMAGLAVLIRPNLLPLAAPMLAWLVVRGGAARRAGDAAAWTPSLIFLGGLAPAVLLAFGANWVFYGSPWLSGYGRNGLLFQAANVPQNLANYASWLTDAEGPLIWIGAAAIALPIRRLWPEPTARGCVAAMALFSAFLVGQYLLYSVFDAWWYLRFLLPAFPIAAVGLGHVAVGVGRRSRWLAALAALAIVATGVRGVVFAGGHDAFELRRGQAVFETAGRTVRGATEPGSVIFSKQHSGSLLFYAGRHTLRYDVMPIDWLDRSIQWLAAHGAHPYALLEPWEVEAWKERFGGRANYGSLPVKPIRVIEGQNVGLYDLLVPGPDEPRRVPVTAPDLECRPPVGRMLPGPVLAIGIPR